MIEYLEGNRLQLLRSGVEYFPALERERLRARYLTLLTHLADHHFSAGDYAACLDYARELAEFEVVAA